MIVNGIRFKNLKHQNLALRVSLHKSCRQQVDGTQKWLTSHLTRNITMDFCRMVWPSASPKFAKSPKRCAVVLDVTTSHCNENNAKEQQQKSHKYTQHSALYVCFKKMVCHVFSSHFFSFCFSFTAPNSLLSQCPRRLQWTVTLFPGKNFPLSSSPSRVSKWVHTHIMSPQCQELEGTTLHKQTSITAHYAQQQLHTHMRSQGRCLNPVLKFIPFLFTLRVTKQQPNSQTAFRP